MKFLVDRCAGATLARWLRDKDFGALVFAKGKAHSGVVRLPDVPAAARIALFERLLAAHQRELAEGAVLTVRGDRVRISR